MRPFLKWAGGKSRLANTIEGHLKAGSGSQATRLIEPFVGSGAVFMGTDFEHYILADLNRDLIDLYKILVNPTMCEDLIKLSRSFFVSENTNEEGYNARRREFNNDIISPPGSIMRAALFVYLNRHGFNGMCRYNKKGEFNIPFGGRTVAELKQNKLQKVPGFPDTEMLAFSKKIYHTEALFVHQGFEETMNQAEPGDVIYCDPPYMPISPTASFTAYAKEDFGVIEHKKLAEMAVFCASRGVRVVISNHNTDYTQALYKGSEIKELEVRRSISSKGDKRLPAKELFAIYEPMTFNFHQGNI
jgi:DNA adenine methylase